MTDAPRRARDRKPPPQDPEGLVICDVPAARRYEARFGDELAGWVDYGRVGSRLVALHT